MFEIFAGILEFMISILCIAASLCSLVYFEMQFIEERLHKMKSFLKVATWFVLIMSILMPFAGFPSAVFFLTFISHALILFLLYTVYPFVYFLRPEFIVSIVITIVNNCVFMIYSLSELDLSFVQSLSYYILYIWGVPILLVTSLAVTEEATEERRMRGTTQNIWASKFNSILQSIKTQLPNSESKYQ